jgi:hypothetical protein
MARKNDSKDVKEALTGRDIADLKQGLTDLSTQMKEGFDGVHLGHKELHEKFASLEVVVGHTPDKPSIQTQIEELKTAFASLRASLGYNKIIWYMCTVLVSMVIALISFILFNR